jgi:uncharacterized protein YbjT (DUF2867 family)
MSPSKTQDLRLPVLDVTKGDVATAKALVEAVIDYGFVFIKNNSGEIPPDNVTGMFDLVFLIQASISYIRLIRS